jgi:hypothetical protein
MGFAEPVIGRASARPVGSTHPTNLFASRSPGALAEKLGPVDVAIVAYQVHAIADTQIQYTWPIIALFKPKLFLPAHHDSAPPAWVDLGLEPLFDKLRAEMPGTAFVAPLYRSPICVAAAGPDKGKVVSFKY